MKTETKNNSFKAVAFMRQARTELAELYQKDRPHFHAELKQAATDFLSRRKRLAQEAKPVS